MRPPEFTGGNVAGTGVGGRGRIPRFNEAAGIHRRKHAGNFLLACRSIHASMRPPEFTGGNKSVKGVEVNGRVIASMRPPEFTGGNSGSVSDTTLTLLSFNEAAGIHRRKQRLDAWGST